MSADLEYMTADTSAPIHSVSNDLFAGFADEEYRHAFIDEHLTTFVPLQIRTIREQRGWTQTELGKRCGNKAQAWISQLEDLNYGKFTLTTLRKLAHAFDCILEVRFRSFKDYSDEQDRRRPGDMQVNTYSDDASASAVPAPASEDTSTKQPATDSTPSVPLDKYTLMIDGTQRGRQAMAKMSLDFEPTLIDRSKPEPIKGTA